MLSILSLKGEGLQSNKNYSLYVGFTDNLKVRLVKHNQGLVQSTKKKIPWEII